MAKSGVGAAAAALTLVVASGCVSTTLIKSAPPGAKVYLDGAYVGQTPYEMSDTKIVGSITHVTLRLDGFAESNVLISRNEKFDAGACLGGVFVLFPFLWIQGYNPEHTYELTPLRYPPGYPQYQGYPPPGYPQGYPQGYPPPAYPSYPYPPQPPAGAPPAQSPGATPQPPPAQIAPAAPAAPVQVPPPAPAQNPAPPQAAPR